MDFNKIRLCFSLFFKPVVLFVLGFFAMDMVGVTAMQPMLAPLANVVAYGIVGIFMLAMYLLAHGAWLLVKAERGIGENCHNCGMPVRYVSPGRYGPYYHCIACGSNRRATH